MLQGGGYDQPDDGEDEPIVITSTLTLNGNGVTVNPNEINVTYDSVYSGLPTPTRDGYTFNGWFVGNTKINNGDKVLIIEDSTAIAKWEVNTYTINYVLDGGTHGNNHPITGTYDSVITIDNPTKQGHEFIGWTVTSGLNAETAKYGVTNTAVINSITSASTKIMSRFFKNLATSGSVTLTANYILREHILTLNGNGVSVTPNQIIVTQDGNYSELPTLEREGYTFNGWYIDTLKIANGDKVTLTGNATATASWTANVYTISLNANGGIVDVLEKMVTYGSTYSDLTTPSRLNYTFNGWYLNDKLITENTIVEILENSELVAKWNLVSPVSSFYCTNASVGSEPYVIKYDGKCEVLNDSADKWRVKFLTSGSLTLNNKVSIDLFLVGGGGGGANNAPIGHDAGCGGGGGGYTKTYLQQTINEGTYSIYIGNGGAANSAGETTYFQNSSKYYANGGKGGSGTAGGNGGSAGGNYQQKGASDGGSLTASGQGTTTKEFGESTGKVYAGGGSGAWAHYTGSTMEYHLYSGSDGGGGASYNAKVGQNGGTNTGGGAGCGVYSTGGTGGSGIVVIRNSKNNDIIIGGKKIGAFVGNFTTSEDANGNWKISFLSSGVLTLNQNMNIDLFLVGGGGGGANNTPIGHDAGCGGGGGGYTQTYLEQTINAGTYEVNIGAGGLSASPGGITYFESSSKYYANGGKGGSGTAGGNGGSAGGNYQQKGASDGGSLTASGQGTTTKEFGETTGKLYAGGGSGGWAHYTGDTMEYYLYSGGSGGGGASYNGTVGQSGIANTGGGGGCGVYSSGGSGGTGIVIMRNTR